jgi:hypothetical protein
LKTIHFWHLKVRQNKVGGGVLMDKRESLLAIPRFFADISGWLKNIFQKVATNWIILYN